MLQVITLAQYSLAYSRSWATNSPNERVRLSAKTDLTVTEKHDRELTQGAQRTILETPCFMGFPEAPVERSRSGRLLAD